MPTLRFTHRRCELQVSNPNARIPPLRTSDRGHAIPARKNDIADVTICLLSIHGLIRAHDLELGRDADTGGQTKYVVELACALARHPRVREVLLVTRLIRDAGVGPDYARAEEAFSDPGGLIRIP